MQAGGPVFEGLYLPALFVHHKGALNDTKLLAQKAANVGGEHQYVYMLVSEMEPGTPIHYHDPTGREWHLHAIITPDPIRRNAGT